jgi:hypothetical protein
MDQVIAMRDGFYAVVNGKLFGPWEMKEYAEAGLQTEIRRSLRALDGQQHSEQRMRLTDERPEPPILDQSGHSQSYLCRNKRRPLKDRYCLDQEEQTASEPRGT